MRMRLHDGAGVCFQWMRGMLQLLDGAHITYERMRSYELG